MKGWVEVVDGGRMLRAGKPNWPGSGLPGAWITHAFMPGPNLDEYIRQAQLWADEPRTLLPTYYAGRVTPKYR